MKTQTYRFKSTEAVLWGPGGSENFETRLAEKIVPRVVNDIYFDEVFDCSSREWTVQREAMNSSITK